MLETAKLGELCVRVSSSGRTILKAPPISVLGLAQTTGFTAQFPIFTQRQPIDGFDCPVRNLGSASFGFAVHLCSQYFVFAFIEFSRCLCSQYFVFAFIEFSRSLVLAVFRVCFYRVFPFACARSISCLLLSSFPIRLCSQYFVFAFIECPLSELALLCQDQP